MLTAQHAMARINQQQERKRSLPAGEVMPILAVPQCPKRARQSRDHRDQHHRDDSEHREARNDLQDCENHGFIVAAPALERV